MQWHLLNSEHGFLIKTLLPGIRNSLLVQTTFPGRGDKIRLSCEHPGFQIMHFWIPGNPAVPCRGSCIQPLELLSLSPSKKVSGLAPFSQQIIQHLPISPDSGWVWGLGINADCLKSETAKKPPLTVPFLPALTFFNLSCSVFCLALSFYFFKITSYLPVASFSLCYCLVMLTKVSCLSQWSRVLVIDPILGCITSTIMTGISSKHWPWSSKVCGLPSVIEDSAPGVLQAEDANGGSQTGNQSMAGR